MYHDLFFFLIFCLQGDPHFASQKQVYADIGKEMLEHAFEGYVLLFVHVNVEIQSEIQV